MDYHEYLYLNPEVNEMHLAVFSGADLIADIRYKQGVPVHRFISNDLAVSYVKSKEMQALKTARDNYGSIFVGPLNDEYAYQSGDNTADSINLAAAEITQKTYTWTIVETPNNFSEMEEIIALSLTKMKQNYKFN